VEPSLAAAFTIALNGAISYLITPKCNASKLSNLSARRVISYLGNVLSRVLLVAKYATLRLVGGKRSAKGTTSLRLNAKLSKRSTHGSWLRFRTKLPMKDAYRGTGLSRMRGTRSFGNTKKIWPISERPREK
jgi:hypothetical protein